MSRFESKWNCAFHPNPPPLIVQALVAENTQYFPFVTVKGWGNKPLTAVATGLVEQQIPAFDSVFFEWFLKRVISIPK